MNTTCRGRSKQFNWLRRSVRVGLRYISTAYVCGGANQIIPEALHPLRGAFNNEYERSKCLAEHLVKESCEREGLDYRIMRPSIVVGLSTTHAAAGSETGLYGFVREAARMARVLRGVTEPVRLVADRNVAANFIPVDLAVDEMLNLSSRGFVGGPVYHVTADISPTVGETLDAICDTLSIPRFLLVPQLDEDASKLELLLARRIAFYASYLKGAKVFARALVPSIAVTARDVQKYVARYLAERQDESSKKRLLLTRDGITLVTTGELKCNRDAVVLINAIGLPSEALDNSALRCGSNITYSVGNQEECQPTTMSSTRR